MLEGGCRTWWWFGGGMGGLRGLFGVRAGVGCKLEA
jgi:hypothetical protein